MVMELCNGYKGDIARVWREYQDIMARQRWEYQ